MVLQRAAARRPFAFWTMRSAPRRSRRLSTAHAHGAAELAPAPLHARRVGGAFPIRREPEPSPNRPHVRDALPWYPLVVLTPHARAAPRRRVRWRHTRSRAAPTPAARSRRASPSAANRYSPPLVTYASARRSGRGRAPRHPRMVSNPGATSNAGASPGSRYRN